MTKEFVSYTQALALKELGFDEPCLAYYQKSAVIGDDTILPIQIRNKASNFNDNEYSKMGVPFCSAPTYSAAFRWFREKHGLLHDITLTLNINDELESFYILIHKLNGLVMNEDDDIELNVKTTNKEEAESACLDKLIEICKNK